MNGSAIADRLDDLNAANIFAWRINYREIRKFLKTCTVPELINLVWLIFVNVSCLTLHYTCVNKFISYFWLLNPLSGVMVHGKLLLNIVKKW